MAILITTFLWGDKYNAKDVMRLCSGFRKHLKQEHRFLCVTNEELDLKGIETTILKDPGLTKIPGCFARLRLFDWVWQKDIGGTDRIVCCDLDCVVTRQLDPLFDRPESFVVLGGANASNPCPFNGSLWMLKAGQHREVWNEFTMQRARETKHYKFPDDQGWFWHMVPNAATWQVGPKSGIYAFQKPGWPTGENLPSDARLVVFPGWRSPNKFKHVPWIREHWKVHQGEHASV